MLADIKVTNSGTRDEVSGADLPWPVPAAAAEPIAVPGFGDVSAKVVLDGSGSLPIDVPPAFAGFRSVTFELVFGWDIVPGPATLLGGAAPITCRLLDRDGASATIEATVHTTLVDCTMRAVLPTPCEAVAVAVITRGSDVVLAVDGFFADRRPLPNGAALLLPTPGGPILIGGASGPAELFAGRIWAVRIHDGVPDALAATANEAADSGVGELDAYFENNGGPAGPLGPAGPEQVVGGVRWREHEHATVCWSASTGARDVRGPFRDHYRQWGGPLGALGLPSSEELSMAAYLDLVSTKRRGAGRGKGLRLNDLVVDKVTALPHVVHFGDLPKVIQTAAEQLTHATGSRPWTDLLAGQQQTFRAEQTGRRLPSALISAMTVADIDGPAPVSAAVLNEVARMTDVAQRFALVRQNVAGRRQQDRLGPVNRQIERDATNLVTAFVRNTNLATALTAWSSADTQLITRDSPAALIADLVADSDRNNTVVRVVDEHGVGWILQGPRAQRFERGAIIWAPGIDATALFTDLLLHWLRHGGSDGFLGLPTSPDITTGGGRTAHFAGGMLAWSAATGAHEVHGDILTRYLAANGPTGPLGFPTSDEEDVPGGRRSTFQGGDIYWTPESGSHTFVGAIREAYLQGGGPERYGVPVTDEVSWIAADGSGVEVRHVTFSTGEMLAWTAGIGVFDHLVLDMGGVRSREIDDEITSDDQPELYVFTTVWLDGVEVVSGHRTPSQGWGPTSFTLDAIPPITVPLHVAGTVRVQVKAWDADTGPDDQFATHDVTYTLENGLFGWLSATRGSHLDAPSTWDDDDTDPDDFTVSYTLAPPFDELARFDRFRQDMYWRFPNFTGPSSLGWDMFSETFEDVVDSTGFPVVDDIMHPIDAIFYAAAYKDIAQNGNCMGMSLLAANTFYRRSGLSQPLSAHPVSDALRRSINRTHGIQAGDAAMVYKMMINSVPGWLDPRQIFNRVKASVDQRTPILVNMRGKKATGDKVGHSTLAYKTDDTSWPRRIWIADPNTPAAQFPDDNGSRIEIDANGAFRMYDQNVKLNTYGSGAFSGSIGDSYLYDFPVAILQGPHYTPDWLVMAGLWLVSSIMMTVGDADVRQVSGGGSRLFGDQRTNTRRFLEHSVTHLDAAVQARLIEGNDGVHEPTAELGRFVAAASLVSQISRLNPPNASKSLTEAVSQLDVSMVETARQAWTGSLGAGVGSIIADLRERITTIDESIDLSEMINSGERVFTPGAWPDMVAIELEQAAAGEMFAHRGPLPPDLVMELVGRAGGTFQQWAATAQSAAMVSSTISHGATDTVRFDRLSTMRPGIQVETSEAAKAVQLGLSLSVDDRSQRWVAWDATLTAAADGPAASLVRADAPLGVVVTAGATGTPVILRSGERSRTTVGPMTRWALPVQGPGERVWAEPADPASPFGAMQTRRESLDGRLIEQVVVEPTG